MTVFRLATATVLLAGLALPALAQGTATPAPAATGTSRGERVQTPAGVAATGAPASVAPASVAPASVTRIPSAAATTPMVPMSPATTPTASAGIVTPQAAVAPGTGRTSLAPVTLPPRAEAGAAEGRVERMGAERAVSSHHRLASATRMERERAPHGQNQAGEIAPGTTR